MKIKISFTQLAGLQIIIISIFILILVIISSFFLYNNFLKTLSSTKRIIELDDQIAQEKINIQAFNQVIKNIETKKAAPLVDWDNFKNPFLPYNSSELEE